MVCDVVLILPAYAASKADNLAACRWRSSGFLPRAVAA